MFSQGIYLLLNLIWFFLTLWVHGFKCCVFNRNPVCVNMFIDVSLRVFCVYLLWLYCCSFSHYKLLFCLMLFYCQSLDACSSAHSSIKIPLKCKNWLNIDYNSYAHIITLTNSLREYLLSCLTNHSPSLLCNNCYIAKVCISCILAQCRWELLSMSYHFFFFTFRRSIW